MAPCVVLCLCFVKVKYSSCFEIFSCVKCSRSSSCVVFCSEAPFKEAFRSALTILMTNLDLSIVLAFPGKNLDDTRRVRGAYSFVRSLNKKLLIRHNATKSHTY